MKLQNSFLAQPLQILKAASIFWLVLGCLVQISKISVSFIYEHIEIDSMKILYLQEDAITLNSASATIPQATISTLYNGWTSATGFTMSIWVKKFSWDPSNSKKSGFFHVSNSPGYQQNCSIGLSNWNELGAITTMEE